jgi:hypothetical protein
MRKDDCNALSPDLAKALHQEGRLLRNPNATVQQLAARVKPLLCCGGLYWSVGPYFPSFRMMVARLQTGVNNLASSW